MSPGAWALWFPYRRNIHPVGCHPPNDHDHVAQDFLGQLDGYLVFLVLFIFGHKLAHPTVHAGWLGPHFGAGGVAGKEG